VDGITDWAREIVRAAYSIEGLRVRTNIGGLQSDLGRDDVRKLRHRQGMFLELLFSHKKPGLLDGVVLQQ
jgi:hypothetical protein